ncbi:MAG: TerB family tellurite resistance protein [Arcobacter sp.]|uniref:TerB family tellurite resistance protein n=1 Tax=Arcobacter sp. TaxID=1872629 RepID=UPI003B00C02E
MKLQTKEKFAFLQLAQHLARVDGEYGNKEQDVIDEYCVEMGIDKPRVFNEEDFNLDDILSAFKTTKSKKIVILELMILVHIDDKYDNKEHELTQKIVDYFKINEKDLKYFSYWGKAVSSLYEQGKLFIED